MNETEINRVAIQAFAKICEYNIKIKAPKLTAMLHPWDFQINKHWSVAVNGRNRIVSWAPKECIRMRIPPLTACLWYDGLGVGWVNPKGGLINPDAVVKIPSFLKAMDALIGKVKADD